MHFGRLEPRTAESRAAIELQAYLTALAIRIDRQVFQDLLALARRHRTTEVIVEKAVDVFLAVDMVVMAERDEYDVAYLLSADGDVTPAVDAVRAKGKLVIAVSAAYGARLRSACNTFIHVQAGWLNDCFGQP